MKLLQQIRAWYRTETNRSPKDRRQMARRHSDFLLRAQRETPVRYWGAFVICAMLLAGVVLVIAHLLNLAAG
jgi:hypothetical protein